MGFDIPEEEITNEEQKAEIPVNWQLVQLLQLALWLSMCIVLIRLFMVIIAPKEKVIQFANSHTGSIKKDLPRGSIYDRNHNVLAYSELTPSLFCSPADIRFPEELAERLSKVLDIEKNILLKKFCATDEKGNKLRSVSLKKGIRDISKYELEKLVYECNQWHQSKIIELRKAKKAKDTGSFWAYITSQFMAKSELEEENFIPKGYPLFLRYEWSRYYPHHNVGGNIIGFVAPDVEQLEDKKIERLIGKDGIEKDWDHFLNPDPIIIEGKKTGAGYLLPSTTIERESFPGCDLHLTLDLEIQHVLERELLRRIEDCNAQDGMGVVLDPYTGAILAIASVPSYDPNLPETRTGSTLKNKAIYETFEPGSTFKIVTATAGLELNKVTKDTIIDCQRGSITVGRKVIRDVHGMGAVPFWKCFEQSSNVAFVKVGRSVGLEQLREYVRRFGFGEKATKDFSAEKSGVISTNKAETTLSSMSIGYAVNVTAIQLARAYAVIANGGYLVEPYIVEKAVLPNGEIKYQHKKESTKQIISPETAEILKILCHQVVLKGTGRSANIPEYKVGGKTGTAHLARPIYAGGGYDPDKIISVFVGFAPINKPRVVCAIVIRFPMSTIRYGGYVCGPVFKNVVYFALTRLNVPPDPVEMNPKNQEGLLAELSIKKDNDLVYLEDGDFIFPEVLPREDLLISDEKEYGTNNEQKNGRKKDGLPLVRTNRVLSRNDLIEIIESSLSKNTLPDLIGLTKMQALEILAKLGVYHECRGFGRVIYQFPEGGTPLDKVDICQLEFSENTKSSTMTQAKSKSE